MRVGEIAAHNSVSVGTINRLRKFHGLPCAQMGTGKVRKQWRYQVGAVDQYFRDRGRPARETAADQDGERRPVWRPPRLEDLLPRTIQQLTPPERAALMQRIDRGLTRR